MLRLKKKQQMTTKQNNLINYAKELGIKIVNIEDYSNRDSLITCICKNGHTMTKSVDNLIKTNFECVECLSLQEKNIEDLIPFFLSLDAATYVTGMSIFNKEGQLLGHKVLSIDRKKDYFVRLREIKEEIENIVKKDNIKCVILEDIQYQQNPILFKKLGMLQGVIRYLIVNDLQVELITALADEWRSYNNIGGIKRPEQKAAAIAKAKAIYKEDISEDESESIFLGKYGIHQYYKNKKSQED